MVNPKSLANLKHTGRPKGSVNKKTQVFNVVLDILAEKKNFKKLKEHMQGLFDRNPSTFYLRFGMPLMPKDINLLTDDDNPIVIKWQK